MNHTALTTTLKLRMTRKLLLTIISCFPLSLFAAEALEKPGMIVLLNGASASGKSSIVKELQKKSGNAFYVVSLDDFIKKHEMETGASWWQELDNDFYGYIKKLSLMHNKILVDTVQHEQVFERYDDILGAGLIKILVYCPLQDLLKHVEYRNQSENFDDHLSVFIAFEQFLSLYKKQSESGELVIDKIRSADIKNVLQEIKKECDESDLSCLHRYIPEPIDERFKQYQKLVQDATDQFEFDDHRKIKIVPRQNIWDLIINSGVSSPVESADEILTFLEMRNYPAVATCTPKLYA